MTKKLEGKQIFVAFQKKRSPGFFLTALPVFFFGLKKRGGGISGGTAIVLEPILNYISARQNFGFFFPFHYVQGQGRTSVEIIQKNKSPKRLNKIK